MDFPVDAFIPEIAAALASGGACVLVAEPGAGKTTRVPLGLLDAAWLGGRKILMLEPRRLAARAAATRMAETLGERVGERVGYTVRLERKVSAATQIEVVTEGILTRRLQHDPSLADVGLIIFDEFHERSLDGDLGLALTLDMQAGLRPDLRIMVMSATIDAEAIASHLGDAQIIRVAGRLFPVETRYLAKADRKTIVQDAVKAELLQTAQLPTSIQVFPLFGAMDMKAQDLALKAPQPGIRKIVLATTIAETSLTIQGITTVIDTGFKRVARFDPASGMTTLETIRVSAAAAEQRRGRAGRLGPGICYRLWPEEEMRGLAAHDQPEILGGDVTPLALELAAWGVADAGQLRWLNAPLPGNFAQARALLTSLGAIDPGITAMGKAMVQMPLHPRLAHMVVKGAELGAGQQAARLAAFLSERDGQGRDAGTNIATRLLGVRGPAASRMAAAAQQIGQGLGQDRTDLNEGVLVALAWPDRIGQKRGGERRYRMAGGGGAILPEHDGLAKSEWLAIATTDGAAGDQKIHLCAALTRAEIDQYFSDSVVTKAEVFWDAKADAVNMLAVTRLGALVLASKPMTDVDADLVHGAMITGVRSLGLAALPWGDESVKLRAQVAFLARKLPEDNWPDLSDAKLLDSLDVWLAPYLAGINRRSHLQRLDMLAIMKDLIPYNLQRQIDELAPRRITVPSGSDIRIDYDTDGDPILRVRLQEMFGLATTPKIARGRVALRIELLSPAMRPLAVTQSLETFWSNGYPDVRAELRGRYPKHSWPEDPLNAPPVKPKPRRF
jgi:ATP-dependent helicase HrpB